MVGQKDGRTEWRTERQTWHTSMSLLVWGKRNYEPELYCCLFSINITRLLLFFFVTNFSITEFVIIIIIVVIGGAGGCGVVVTSVLLQ